MYWIEEYVDFKKDSVATYCWVLVCGKHKFEKKRSTVSKIRLTGCDSLL